MIAGSGRLLSPGGDDAVLPQRTRSEHGGLSDGVMGALIGAGAALLTGLLTVWLGWLVASRQLRHDREERSTDRALQSRRDRLFISLSAATDVTRSTGSLARPSSNTSEAADRFSDAVNTLAPAGSVVSLEVVERGRDLVGQAGRLFPIAISKRASLDKEAAIEDWSKFGDWAIDAQVQLQRAYGLLLAAVRRDLRIPHSLDDQVLAATAVDVQAPSHASAEAKVILISGRER